MNWLEIKSGSDLNEVIENSFQSNFGVAIFKHSTRCSISSVAKMRLSSLWSFNEELPVYYVDVLASRNLSNLIANEFNVVHESPQLLIIRHGKCVYDASHMSISYKDIVNYSNQLKIKT